METVRDLASADLLALLPAKLARKLTLFCEATGDDPADVIAEALALHFDALEGDAALGGLAAEVVAHGTAQ